MVVALLHEWLIHSLLTIICATETTAGPMTARFRATGFAELSRELICIISHVDGTHLFVLIRSHFSLAVHFGM